MKRILPIFTLAVLLLFGLDLVFYFLKPGFVSFHFSFSLPPPANKNIYKREKVNRELVVSALGDILFLKSMSWEGYISGFTHFWSELIHCWNESDYVVSNFEGVTGPINKSGVTSASIEANNKFNVEYYDAGVSSGGFNYHSSLVKEIKEAGINILSTANNHAFDRGFEGITSTFEILKQNNILTLGSSVVDIKERSLKWVKLTNKNGFRIAWIGCTNILCATCRRKLRSTEELVALRILKCRHVPELIKRLRHESSGMIDAIFVVAHWGVQFKQKVSPSVEALAISLLDSGATVIFGNHPHLLQRSFSYLTKDGRKTYCMYSLGSLTSGLGSYDVKKYKLRASAVVKISLRLSNRNFLKADVFSVEFTPICEVWENATVRKMVVSYKRRECERELEWVERNIERVREAQVKNS